MAATQQAVSKYKVLGPLPAGVPYLRRFRATQAMFERDVEIRLPAVDPPIPADPLFLQELDELVGLDHGAFLPVLDRGGSEARGYYVVPLREEPSLESLIRDPGYGFEARCQTIRQLARALAVLHEKGIVLGALSAALIAVQKDRGNAWFVHHRFPVVAPPEGNLLPPDCQAGAKVTPRTDVFRWACLAYTLFSRGASTPYESKAGEISGFLQHVPQFPPAVVDVMEECLAATPSTRPATAGELVAKLDARWAALAEMEVSWDPLESTCRHASLSIL